MAYCIKTCAQCGVAFEANCGVERYCSDECLWRSSFDGGAGCWIWNRARDRDGYGVLRLKGRKRVKAHRYAYELEKGNIPAGYVIRHSCDNPACVNPDHLEVGTHGDNKRDAVARGRDCRGERHHKAKLTEADVRAIRASIRGASEIALLHGITKENVYAIRKGKIWRHVQ